MDHGARIIKARNGNEVIHLLKTKCIPDLILMDMSMPVKDGFETSAEVKSLWPQIPILAVTAHAMSGDEEQCRMAGCNDYISKPVNPGLLFAKITKIITDKKKIMN
jgi:CheY-like chemotaxis protein